MGSKEEWMGQGTPKTYHYTWSRLYVDKLKSCHEEFHDIFMNRQAKKLEIKIKPSVAVLSTSVSSFFHSATSLEEGCYGNPVYK